MVRRSVDLVRRHVPVSHVQRYASPIEAAFDAEQVFPQPMLDVFYGDLRVHGELNGLTAPNDADDGGVHGPLVLEVR